MAENASLNISVTNDFESILIISKAPAPPAAFISPINHKIYLWFTVVFFVIGLCGNTAVILAFILFKKLRSLGNVFIVNTAVADICVGFFGDLFIIVGIATKGKFLVTNPPLCVISSYLCASVCFVAIWSIAAASFNGYVRVCHHLVYSKIYTPATVTLMLVAIWAAGFLILLPTVLGWGSHYYNPILMFCFTNPIESVSYIYFATSVGLGVPFVIIIYSFTRIIVTVRASRKNLKNHGKGRRKGEIRVIRSVMVIAGYFIASVAFVTFIQLMGSSYPGSYVSIVVAVVLAHTHCALTGILYAMTNKRYRDAYKKMFCFCWRRRGKVSVESTTSGRTSGMSSARTVSGAVTSVTKA